MTVSVIRRRLEAKRANSRPLLRPGDVRTPEGYEDANRIEAGGTVMFSHPDLPLVRCILKTGRWERFQGYKFVAMKEAA